MRPSRIARRVATCAKRRRSAAEAGGRADRVDPHLRRGLVPGPRGVIGPGRPATIW